MSRKEFIETSIKEFVARRKEYLLEYNRVVETINNRISDRIAENPKYDAFDPARQAVELMGKIEHATRVIKMYEKELEEIS